MGFLQFQLLFARSFPVFSGFFRLLGWVLGAVLVISAVSATFCRVFSGFWAEFGGAVLVISAVSATFCEASGIMVEAQHHKLTTTY